MCSKHIMNVALECDIDPLDSSLNLQVATSYEGDSIDQNPQMIREKKNIVNWIQKESQEPCQQFKP